MGDHHGQETGLKCDLDSSRKKRIFGSGTLLCQRFRRMREETAWKWRSSDDEYCFTYLKQ
jgi:hypothetical protein